MLGSTVPKEGGGGGPEHGGQAPPKCRRSRPVLLATAGRPSQFWSWRVGDTIGGSFFSGNLSWCSKAKAWEGLAEVSQQLCDPAERLVLIRGRSNGVEVMVEAQKAESEVGDLASP